MLLKIKNKSPKIISSAKSRSGYIRFNDAGRLVSIHRDRVEQELNYFIRNMDRLYHLYAISPILFKNIRDFICRKGKRVRPLLFIFGYLGFTKKPATGIYQSAIALELLHDFMLVHDDIIDKSDTRRGNPSMHAMFNNYLKNHKGLKFNGQDLTIVAGDVMYAMALHAFLAVKEDPQRKEKALKKLIETALYTGSGEFIELLSGLKHIEQVTKEEIYKIYDLKTANYTFSAPLTIGATLAGANPQELRRLSGYGLYLGRAFQIKDDIIGIFQKESEIGKSNLTDLSEGKKTLLVCYAFGRGNRKDKAAIKKVFSSKKIGRRELETVRRIILKSGALDYAKKEVSRLIKKSQEIIQPVKMSGYYKEVLDTYIQEILKL